MIVGVTGHLGSLGSALLRLSTDDVKVVPVDTKESSLPDCDAVIGCIGRIPASATTVNGYVNDNIRAPGWWSAWCQNSNVPFVHVSSDCVYGDRPYVEGGPLSERARPSDDPIVSSLYSLTKAVGDAYVLENGGTVVRTSFVTPRRQLWCDLLMADAEGRKLHELVEFPAWERVRWSGSTVAEVSKKLLAAVAARRLEPGQVYNLATQHPVSKAQVVEHLVRKLGLMVWPQRVREPAYTRAMSPNFVLKSVLEMDQKELLESV